MIFKPELAQAVLDGRKTVTRRAMSDNPRSPWSRLRCAYRPGKQYAVQPGRAKRAIGHLEIISVKRSDLRLDDAEAQREGFDSAIAFKQAWTAMHGSYRARQVVWRLEFAYVHMQADCERELKAHPDYDMFRCKPEQFTCSCGRQYTHVCSEPVGCFYLLVSGE